MRHLLFLLTVGASGCGSVLGTDMDACTPACRSGFTCTRGTCVSECNPECDQGMSCIGGQCVTNNCNPACSLDTHCEGTTCVPDSCTGSQITCGMSCVDPQTSSMYCGAKGNCTGTDPSQPNYTGMVCGAGGCNAGVCDPSSLTITVTTMNYDVHVAAGSPTTPRNLTVTIANGVSVTSANTNLPAFTTGALPAGSTVTLIISPQAQIVGAGGAGGSGGNGGSGGVSGKPPCGRAGLRGGTALQLTIPATITNNGLIAGGGGGGGGLSGCNVNGGGGGGAGIAVGQGGAAASLPSGTAPDNPAEVAFCGQDNGVRGGTAGTAGGTLLGGAGGDPNGANQGAGGNGGGLGQPGQAATSCVGDSTDGAGGAAGFAIHRGPQTITIADGAYSSGAGPIRGPVGP